MAGRESILAAIENRRKSSTPSSPVPASTSDLGASTSTGPIPKAHNYSDFDKDHDRRQEFRRLVDPGITRPNSREVAYEAIKVRSCPLVSVIESAVWADGVSKTLLMLAGNIIDHPDEDKYHRFKPTNTAIRRKIVDPKGSLEYAVEVRAAYPCPILGFTPRLSRIQLGFRPEVKSCLIPHLLSWDSSSR